MCESCFSGKPVRRRELFEDYDFQISYAISGDERPSIKSDGAFHGRRHWPEPNFFSMCMAMPRVFGNSLVRQATVRTSANWISRRTAWKFYRRASKIHDFLISNICSRAYRFNIEDYKAIRHYDEKSAKNMPMLGRKGIDHPLGVLTDEEVLAIRKEVAHGDSHLSTADKYGVSTSIVYRICNGEHRADIGGPMTPFAPDHRSKVSTRVASEMWARRRAEKGLPLLPSDIPANKSWCGRCGDVLAVSEFSNSQMKKSSGSRRCRVCLGLDMKEGRQRRDGWKPATGAHPYRRYPKHDGPIPPPFKRTNPELHTRQYDEPKERAQP